jgi:Flp pilus assembly protein TadG
MAACELAVCLPVIILLTFASIEASTMIFVDQALCVAGYEGVRLAIQGDATNDDVIDRCEEFLGNRKVVGATISFEPADVSAVNSGGLISITVSAPSDDNAVGPPIFFWGTTLSATSTMVKE